jgi:hypothetical protein
MRASQNLAGKTRTLSSFPNSGMVHGHIPKVIVKTLKVESGVKGKVRRNAGFAASTAYFGKRSGPPLGSLGQALA